MIGKTISHYKILEKLGEGGMGVVYKAQDNKLERTVALKFLSLTSIGTDEEKKRFKREAKAAAALNHPKIAHIYEIDEAEGQTFIAMEYIEGNSLYEIVRANGGSPLPIEDTINYTIQIAEGLQAAHEKGIVHRDIKSANIIVTEKGRVKIMDFGLAKLVGRSKVTQLGTILGTASYMSPEQARGEVVDHRADIWSLGVVLYEMISGQLPFKGDYEQAVIYSILNEAPAPLTALRTGVPMELERIVNKLLEKVPESRYQHVDELPADLKTERIAFKRTSKAATSHSVVNFTKKPKSRLRFWFSILASVIMGVFLMLFVLTQFDYLKPDTRNEPKTLKKFIINLPENQELASSSCFPLGIGHPSIAISPDGTKIVYVIEQEGRTILYLHSLDAWESQAITGTEGGYHPFFSPDGAWVGFLTNNKLKKIALDGGEPFSLCDIVHPMGATWSEDGWIYFAQLQGQKLSRVSAEGGNLEDVMIGRDFAWPQALPGGKAVLFWEGQRSRNQDYGHAFVYNVVTGENKMVFEGAAMVRYSPTGHLVYGRGGALYVVPFNVERLETKGSPTLILQGVRTEPARGAVQFSLSTDGTLVYITGPNRDIMRFVWVDRTGNVTPLHLPMQSYGEFKISPDGKQLAVVFRVEKADIWIYEFARESWIRLTLEGDNYSPVWSPDGTQITFRSNRSGTWKLYRKNAEASGAVECLPQTSEEAFHHPFTWILDGRFLLFYTSREGKRELWLLANEDTLKIQPYFGKSTGTIFNSVSPDDHWIAYTSDDLGTWEVFVEEFPSSKKRWKVSLNGGEQPRWSPDGKELYYRNKAQWFLVPISTKSGFEAGKPRVLFEGPYIQVSGFSWDIHPDGKRFLVLQAQEHENPTQLRMVLNWCNEVKRLSQENQ